MYLYTYVIMLLYIERIFVHICNYVIIYRENFVWIEKVFVKIQSLCPSHFNQFKSIDFYIECLSS
jgi:hypothetical protein